MGTRVLMRNEADTSVDRPAALRAVAAPATAPSWAELIRAHDHRVVVSLLAMGLRLDLAKEIAHQTWARLYEQHANHKLERLELPGLAIAQARFLALDQLRRDRADRARWVSLDASLSATTPDNAATPELRLIERREVERALSALATCSPSAQRVFRMVYDNPSMPHAEAAERLGLSVQRVRQVLCEVRRTIRDALERQDGGER